MKVDISAFLEPLLSFSHFKTMIIHIYDVWICEKQNKIDVVDYNKKDTGQLFVQNKLWKGWRQTLVGLMMFMNRWSETIKGPDKLFHNFFVPKLTGTISGSRISRSRVKGNCTKRQLFADFSYLLKYCNWSSGIVNVCNLRSLIGFF